MPVYTRKFYIIVALCLLATCRVYAQTITGRIHDAAGMPLVAAAVIRLAEKDSSLQQGTLTDEDGRYQLLQGPEGKTILRAQAIGYKTFTWVVTGADAKTIQMAMANANALKEVQIIGQKPFIEVRADMMVVNVAGSINAQGNTALDLLRKAPGIMVDKDENVSLKGKSVTILIDGRPTQMSGTDLANYLKTVQSADLETIELITNPSAKYEASGAGGIINIKLKKNKNYGTNGTASLTYNHGIFNKHNQNINLNNRNKKLNLFGNAGTFQGTNRSFYGDERIQSDSVYRQNAHTTNKFNGYNYKAGADYYIDSKNTVGILATGGHNDGKPIRDAFTSIQAVNGPVVRSLSALSKDHSQRDRLNTNINYRYQDTSGREFTADADYGLFTAVNNRLVTNTYRVPGSESLASLYAFRMYTPITVNLGVLKADYEQKLWGGKLLAGARATAVNTRNNFNFYDTTGRSSNLPFNTERSNQFSYREQVNAVYAQYTGKLGTMLDFQAGLRIEQTSTRGLLNYRSGRADSLFTRRYTNPFPSAGVTYHIAKKHDLGLTYSRRIDRPNYETLNPFQIKQDDFSFRSGNPYLLPQFTNSVEITHTHNASLVSSLSYSRTTNAFAEIVAKADARRNYIQTQNLARIERYSFNVSTPLAITAWWEGYANVSVNYSIFNPTFGADNDLAEFGATTLRNFNSNAFIQQSFTLGKGYKAEISGWGATAGVWGGTFETGPMGSVDLGIKKNMMHNRSTVKVSLQDIFFTAPWTGQSEYGGIKTTSGGNWESRCVVVYVDYRFGSDDIKGSRGRKMASDDLQSRVGTGG